MHHKIQSDWPNHQCYLEGAKKDNVVIKKVFFSAFGYQNRPKYTFPVTNFGHIISELEFKVLVTLLLD